MSTALSLDQAAKRAKVSRWTISRALQAGRLRGTRDNRQRWRVDAEDLDRWLSEQSTVQHDEQHRAAHGAAEQINPLADTLRAQLEQTRQERDQARLEVATLSVELVQARERLVETSAHLHQRLIDAQAEREREVAQLREDRDRWHVLATKPNPTPVPQPWLARIWASLRPAGV